MNPLVVCVTPFSSVASCLQVRVHKLFLSSHPSPLPPPVLCSSADHKNMFGACHRFAVSLPEFRQVTPLSCPSQSGAHLTALRSSSPLSSHLKWLTHSCQLGSRRVGARSEQPFSTSTIATRGASPMHAKLHHVTSHGRLSFDDRGYNCLEHQRCSETYPLTINDVLKHVRSRLCGTQNGTYLRHKWEKCLSLAGAVQRHLRSRVTRVASHSGGWCDCETRSFLTHKLA